VGRVADGQQDFSGGMIDRLSPELLPANAYAYLLNGEIRDGTPKTRRGSVLLEPGVTGSKMKGAGLYRSPYEDQRRETLVYVLGATIYRVNLPERPVAMTLPAGEVIGDDENIRFIQANEYLYALRGPDRNILRWDGYTFNEWTAIATPAVGDKMPNAAFGCYAYNRLWLVQDQDTLIASDLLSEAFDLAAQSWDISAGDGGRIQAVVPWTEGALVVFKERSVHLVGNCNGDLTDIVRQILDNRHGLVSPDGWSVVGLDVWYLSQDGIRTISLTAEGKTQAQDVTVSQPIPNLLATANWQTITTAQAVQFDNYVLLAVPSADHDRPDRMFVYDLLARAWVGVWTGLPCCRLVPGISPFDLLYGLGETGQIDLLLAYDYTDSTPSWPAYFTFGDTGKLTMTLAAYTWKTSARGDLLVEVNFRASAFDDWVTLVSFYASTSGHLKLMYKGDIKSLLFEVEYSGSVVTQWTAALSADLFDGRWHTIAVRGNSGDGDGLYIDGSEVTVTYVVGPGARWIYDFVGANLAVQIGESSRGTGVDDLAMRTVKYIDYDDKLTKFCAEVTEDDR
jgi:hypothetical protein